MVEDPKELVYQLAREADLLFNEDKGTDKAHEIHKARLVKFASLIAQQVLKEVKGNL